MKHQKKNHFKEVRTLYLGKYIEDPNKRACLISGQPGIGKTTFVRLLAKEYGYELIEYNASDIRNKSSL